MDTLPERGVGVIYAPGLEPLLEAGGDLVDVVEIEPQSFWFTGATTGDLAGPARRIVQAAGLDRRPALVHGVGSPIGGTVAPSSTDVADLAAIADHLDSAWVSEHLSFNHIRVGGRTSATGLMLPPVQTSESAQLAAASIVECRRRVGRPFAFETGVNYLRPRADEMTDGAWWLEVADTADCGILLDLHNVWCNARNGRQSLDDLFADLPLDRVWEVHVAGGEQVDGMWLDSHSGLVDGDLLAIAAEIVPELPSLRAIVFEIVPEYLLARGIATGDVESMLVDLHEVWDLRRPASSVAGVGPPPVVDRPAGVDDLAAAEVALARAVLDGGSSDPGVRVMGRLVEAIRRGLTVTVLPLSIRLVRLTLGPTAVDDALHECWRRHPPELYADAEAAHLAEVLRQMCGTRVPHLHAVLDYETALVALARTGRAPVVPFGCDPLALLSALGRGEMPAELPLGSYELDIVPDPDPDPDPVTAPREMRGFGPRLAGENRSSNDEEELPR